MPTSAEEEAERLKNEREAAAAKQSDQHQAVIASTLPNGMVKEQMQAQAERPDANNKTQEIKDYERRQEADAELKARYAKAAENNPPHPTIQHSELIAADNAKAVAENIKTEQRQKEEAARQETAKAADNDKAETAKAEQAKADEQANEAKRIEAAQAIERGAAEPTSRFAQRRAQLDNQQATQLQERQREDGATYSRFAERRKADQSSQRFVAGQEQSDWRQRQAARAEQRPAREATEARASLANNADGKQKDREGNER